MNRSPRRLLALTAGLALSTALAVTHVAPAAADRGCTGASIAGDVNGDNRAEVAVTQLGRHDRAGAVHVFYGTDRGLVTDPSGRALDDQLIEQSSPGVPGSDEPLDEFGAATAWGDFDLDGCADLAIGTPGENTDDGAVTIVYGSPRGLTTARAQHFDFVGLFGSRPGNGGRDARFGEALAVGDFDHDAVPDLAIGAQALSVGESYEVGGVAVVYGHEGGGLDAGTRAELLTRATPGIPGELRPEERFGRTLVVGDFDRNFIDQLAVISASNPGSMTLGNIQVLERGPSGFTRRQPDPIPQAAAQRGPGSPYDGFGLSAASADVDGDGFADLAVGAPGRGCRDCQVDAYGFGEVVVLFGSAAGLGTTGRQIWTQQSTGIPTPARVGDGFGASLVAVELDSSSGAELAVGAPGDEDKGSVTVLKGGAGGLGAPTYFTQDTPGIGGAPGPYDFGGSLSASYVQGGLIADLVIGSPDQSIGGVRAVGLINQLVASPAGPKARGGRAIHLGTSGVKGESARQAHLGAALS